MTDAPQAIIITVAHVYDTLDRALDRIVGERGTDEAKAIAWEIYLAFRNEIGSKT